MKLVDRYYAKLYKQTEKITKKLFGKDVTGAMVLRYDLKKEIEITLQKSINEVTYNEISKHKLNYSYAKYRTVSKILDVLENACVLKTFTIEELENEC